MEWLSEKIYQEKVNPRAPKYVYQYCTQLENRESKEFKKIAKKATKWLNHHPLFVPPNTNKILAVLDEMQEKKDLLWNNCYLPEDAYDWTDEQKENYRNDYFKAIKKKYNISDDDLQNISVEEECMIVDWVAALTWIITGSGNDLYGD